MFQEDSGKSPRGREAKGHVSRWLIAGGAFAVAMLMVSVALGATTAHAQENLAFVATVEPMFDFYPPPDGDGTDDCGGGQVILTVSADRTYVVSDEPRETSVLGNASTTLIEFEPGEFAIDQSGSFSFTTEGWSKEGAFDFDADPPAVTGTATIFQADDPSNVLCVYDFSGSAEAGAALPSTGSGPAAGSYGGLALWLVLAASLGAFGLATTGLAIMRRRGA